MTQAEERYNSDDVPNAEHPQQGDWFKCVCHTCGWFGLSRDAAGGEPTGGDDYEDVRCPKCDGELHDPTRRDVAIARAAYMDGAEQSERFIYGDGPIRHWELANGLQLKLYPEYNHDGGFYFSWLQEGERWTNKLGPGDIMEALKEQGRTTLLTTLDDARKEALERYPVTYAMRDLPDSYEGPDYEEYDVNKEARDAFVMGRLAGPLVTIEALLERVESAERERKCCHDIWDQSLEIMGYDLSKAKPLFTDAVKNAVEKSRWIPVDERLPDVSNGISKVVLVKLGYPATHQYNVAWYSMSDEWNDWSCDDVLAWMEIPE